MRVPLSFPRTWSEQLNLLGEDFIGVQDSYASGCMMAIYRELKRLRLASRNHRSLATKKFKTTVLIGSAQGMWPIDAC